MSLKAIAFSAAAFPALALAHQARYQQKFVGSEVSVAATTFFGPKMPGTRDVDVQFLMREESGKEEWSRPLKFVPFIASVPASKTFKVKGKPTAMKFSLPESTANSKPNTKPQAFDWTIDHVAVSLDGKAPISIFCPEELEDPRVSIGNKDASDTSVIFEFEAVPCERAQAQHLMDGLIPHIEPERPVVTDSKPELPIVTDPVSSESPIVTDPITPELPIVTDPVSSELPIVTDPTSPELQIVTDPLSSERPIITDPEPARPVSTIITVDDGDMSPPTTSRSSTSVPKTVSILTTANNNDLVTPAYNADAEPASKSNPALIVGVSSGVAVFVVVVIIVTILVVNNRKRNEAAAEAGDAEGLDVELGSPATQSHSGNRNSDDERYEVL